MDLPVDHDAQAEADPAVFLVRLVARAELHEGEQEILQSVRLVESEFAPGAAIGVVADDEGEIAAFGDGSGEIERSRQVEGNGIMDDAPVGIDDAAHPHSDSQQALHPAEPGSEGPGDTDDVVYEGFGDHLLLRFLEAQDLTGQIDGDHGVRFHLHLDADDEAVVLVDSQMDGAAAAAGPGLAFGNLRHQADVQQAADLVGDGGPFQPQPFRDLEAADHGILPYRTDDVRRVARLFRLGHCHRLSLLLVAFLNQVCYNLFMHRRQGK